MSPSPAFCRPHWNKQCGCLEPSKFACVRKKIPFCIQF
jgi:hypothetical protein